MGLESPSPAETGGPPLHPSGRARGAAGWHVTSPEEAGDVPARGFQQPVCVASNGVEAPTADARATALQRWRELCPETAERPVALFYSRFHRKKRVLELIDLWIKEGPRDWLLLMVGIPEDYDVAALDEYVLRALGRGRLNVHDQAGQPPPYSVATLFLLHSHSENFRAIHRGGPGPRRAGAGHRHHPLDRSQPGGRWLVRAVVRLREGAERRRRGGTGKTARPGGGGPRLGAGGIRLGKTGSGAG